MDFVSINHYPSSKTGHVLRFPNRYRPKYLMEMDGFDLQLPSDEWQGGCQETIDTFHNVTVIGWRLVMILYDFVWNKQHALALLKQSTGVHCPVATCLSGVSCRYIPSLPLLTCSSRIS